MTMSRQHTNRLIHWRATIVNATARFQRPKVTAILCRRCDKWVKPRRYDPIWYACNSCVPEVSYAYYLLRRATAQDAIAADRAYQRELRQWRRQAAAQRRQAVTSAV